ncbi:MAG TPA: type III pantothenate kinase [Alphaproteobacteria bacterium]|nr:type III pantothenate kinase [Alphaproteobacteria bacterium]
MLAAIDSGNTNVVFAVYDGDALRGEWRSSSDPNRTADEYAVWLSHLMGLEDLTFDDIDEAIIANVVPAAFYALRMLCRRYFNCVPLVIGEDNVDLGVAAKVDHPEEVGADRLVNAVGAAEQYGGPLIIVDFGTATTFDVVDADGAYVGGVIAPGINLSLEALHMAAAKLPRIDVARPARVIGRSTVPAMQSGVYWGYVSLIEGMIARIEAEYGAEMTVVATGGLAPLFAEATQAIQHLDRELTMRGLLSIHRRNTAK